MLGLFPVAFEHYIGTCTDLSYCLTVFWHWITKIVQYLDVERDPTLYEDEVDATLSGLTSLIEPILIVFLGVVIGGIVVCMFMPIFKMHEIVAF